MAPGSGQPGADDRARRSSARGWAPRPSGAAPRRWPGRRAGPGTSVGGIGKPSAADRGRFHLGRRPSVAFGSSVDADLWYWKASPVPSSIRLTGHGWGGCDDAGKTCPGVATLAAGGTGSCAGHHLLATAPASAIIGGRFDADRHPYAGAVDTPGPRSGGYASGVLISPTVFLTAGHVTRSAFDNQGSTRAAVTFDPIATDASKYHVGTVHTNHPEYDPQSADAPGDLGVIVFDEPVLEIAPAALPTAGLLDRMGPQALQRGIFPVVGYGIARFQGGASGGGEPHPDVTSGGARNVAEQRF